MVCLYGEETWQRDQLLEFIIDHTVPENARDFNLSQFHGRQANGRDILEQVQTLPVFTDRRMVVVRDAEHLRSADLEYLLPAVRNPVAESVLIFVADKIDKRRRFWQEVSKKGDMVEFRPLYADKVPTYVEKTLSAQRWRMTQGALELFCRRVGTNLHEIHAELDKLRAYIGDRNSADVEDVNAVISRVAEEGVFDLAHAIGRGQVGQALTLLGQLIDSGEAPVFILAMITRHFRQLWSICLALERGVGRRQMASELGINPYFVDGLIAQARHFSAHSFPGLLERLLEVDLTLKSSGSFPRAVLEQVVFDLAAMRATVKTKASVQRRRP